jgi:adenylate cyclase
MPGCIRLLLLGALLRSLCSCGESRREQPIAEDGRLDLSDWDFEKHGTVMLKGQWLFAWEEFLDPMSIQELRSRYKSVVSLPGVWNTQVNPNEPENLLPGAGYGTYALEVQLPAGVDSGQLGLVASIPHNAGEWFVLSPDGTEVLGNLQQGKVGSSAETTVPVWVGGLSLLEQGHNRFLILVHVSSFRHARGGMWSSSKPNLGLEKNVEQEEFTELLINAITAGILIIIALYHFVLFAQRREGRASLYFAALCSILAMRQWITGRFSQSLGFCESVKNRLCRNVYR